MPAPGLSSFFDRSRKGEMSLLAVTAAIYFFYFHHVLLNVNSVMTSITFDTIKNYYTFVYHIVHDDSMLHFGGMQYPFGDHVVYTDCQPALTFLLRPLTFLHPYAVGILHSLFFVSFVSTPAVIRRVLLNLEVKPELSWCGALGLGILSPQFLKMNAGHFALCYTVMIPLAMLMVIRLITKPLAGPAIALFLYNSLIFWIHPYMGVGLSLFSLLCLLFVAALGLRPLRMFTVSLVTGLLPFLAFRLIMAVTDHHPDRPVEPYGLDVMVENTGSLLTPVFGPFSTMLEAVFPERTEHFEGHTYLGLANILLLAALPFLILIARKKKFNNTSVVFFAAGLIFLPVAFGWHHQLMRFIGIESEAVNQFRAVCRFAWFTYYATGVFLLSSLSRALNSTEEKKSRLAAVLYLALSLLEGHYFLTLDDHAFWKWRNIFNKEQLTATEKTRLAAIDSIHPQAIVPLPIFHGGSEMYDRAGGNESMVPAFFYSYHAALPLVSNMASRTSHPETKAMLDLLNTYKKDRPVLSDINGSPFILVKTTDPILPDESRLWSLSQKMGGDDSLQFAVAEERSFCDPVITSDTLVIPFGCKVYSDTARGVLYQLSGEGEVFTTALTQGLHQVAQIKPGVLPAGKSVLSFHYHYEGNNYRALATSFVLAHDAQSGNEWLTYHPVRQLSGFYDGFAVFECFIDLEADKGYDLLLHGQANGRFRISDLMIRPEKVTVIKSDGSAINNFPR